MNLTNRLRDSNDTRQMLITEWAAIEKYLEPLLGEPGVYATAWRTAYYEFTVHKQAIMCMPEWGPDGLITKVLLVPFSNENYYDNALAWPSPAEKLSFVLDGQNFHNNWALYYAAKKARYNVLETIRPNIRSWWLNGHLLCNTEGQWTLRGLDELSQLLNQVLVGLADGPRVFFVNRRDFPHHRRYGQMTPLTAFDGAMERPIFFGMPKCPIFSFYGSPNYEDLLLPTPEAVRAASRLMGPPIWPKKQQAVFRGTLTGRYTDGRNVRLQIVALGLRRPDILDAALTAWTPRDRIQNGIVAYSGPPDWCTIGRQYELTMDEQMRYAILVYAPGHVAAGRMDWYLRSGCCIVVVQDPECQAPLQFIDTYETLTEDVHYVRSTVADLESNLNRLSADPDLCRRIGTAAYEWALKNLNLPAMVKQIRTQLWVS